MHTTMSVFIARDPLLDEEALRPILARIRTERQDYCCDICKVEVGHLPSEHGTLWRSLYVTVDLVETDRDPVLLCEDCAPLDGYTQVVSERMKALASEEDPYSMDIPSEIPDDEPEMREATEAYLAYVGCSFEQEVPCARRVAAAFRALAKAKDITVEQAGGAVQHWYIVRYVFPQRSL